MNVSPIRVLVVEDSATMRSFLSATLEAQGIEVRFARSGLEALKVLPNEQFDLVITDINMPDVNGLELVRFVRESRGHARTPLLVISTDGRPRDQERALERGANAYLVKPFSPAQLLDALRGCLPAA